MTPSGVSEISPLHLVLGDEELLVERAVGDIVRAARERARQAAAPTTCRSTECARATSAPTSWPNC
ncbi:DNA polymerase III, delta subunit HolA domain protein [Mycobacterium ulcerans str. Harvey]|uniref:DNA polymerase III, delta subunit HolA domain protein n=1 Tax=Mycobacterium ulcerans str. Harvey TaxID=1299332 RepID=A0ABN0QSC4_MYCUL|nr:DNA polymerase III, delta subunit HolA domain protein [Mycobacterium ulcerans str. Harvey]